MKRDKPSRPPRSISYRRWRFSKDTTVPICRFQLWGFSCVTVAIHFAVYLIWTEKPQRMHFIHSYTVSITSLKKINKKHCFIFCFFVFTEGREDNILRQQESPSCRPCCVCVKLSLRYDCMHFLVHHSVVSLVKFCETDSTMQWCNIWFLLFAL